MSCWVFFFLKHQTFYTFALGCFQCHNCPWGDLCSGDYTQLGGIHPKARLNKCGVQLDRRTPWILWKSISKGVPHVPQKVPDSLSGHTMVVMITASRTEIAFNIPSVSLTPVPCVCPLPAQALLLWKCQPEQQSLNPDASSACPFRLCFMIIPAASLICVKEKIKQEYADGTANKWLNRISGSVCVAMFKGFPH